MILSLLLCLVLAFGFYVMWKYTIYIGFIITFFSIMSLVFHVMLEIRTPYNFELYLEKRTAFSRTVNNMKDSKTIHENEEVVKMVLELNMELAKKQYQNKLFIIGYYTDDRYIYLEPITLN